MWSFTDVYLQAMDGGIKSALSLLLYLQPVIPGFPGMPSLPGLPSLPLGPVRPATKGRMPVWKISLHGDIVNTQTVCVFAATYNMWIIQSINTSHTKWLVLDNFHRRINGEIVDEVNLDTTHVRLPTIRSDIKWLRSASTITFSLDCGEP